MFTLICFYIFNHWLSIQVRAASLQELVYKRGQAGVTKATVTIIFDNTDKTQSPLGYNNFDEITVSRQVSTSKLPGLWINYSVLAGPY